MSKDTRNIGLAFLASIILTAGVALAADLLFASQVSETACFKSYTMACVF
ncbi:MAG: hypothetical protein PHE68_00735 [Candidatus Peribacteraceae bacterium]|nr:hypothetical protein [Candidatus Peribacteraceae bacterium]MDD5074322.1 hypothetical protein [Candidatus Peribacteraceae bacterium]